MGAANVIPGVSGGTIALITGIFERLINSIKSFNLTALKLFFTGKFKEFAKATDFRFLCSVFIGIVIAILSVAKLFEYLFENYPVFIWAFFLDLSSPRFSTSGKPSRNGMYGQFCFSFLAQALP